VSLRRSPEGFGLGYALATDRSGDRIATAVVNRILGVCAEAAPSRAGILHPTRLGPDPRDTLIFVATVGDSAAGR
jgi:hypothetical protein